MLSVHPTLRRAGGLLAASVAIVALVAVNTAAAAPTSAPCATGAPVLDLANPNPGDVLPNGDIIISGSTFDPSGSAISRVDLFLGARDSGGLFLGSAVPTGSTFTVKASLPSSTNGGRDFVAYATSANGQQTSVSVPVFIGAAPTPTPTGTSAAPVALSETVSSTCSPAVVIPAPAPGQASAFQPLPLNPVVVAPVLQLANPSAGDVLSNGDVVIQGLAYDPAATADSGVDRIELFLDSRESGGTFLGEGVPTGRAFTITAKLGSANGGHNLVAYARSSVTGRETVVTVPLFVGVAPTPTPRPSSGN